MIRKRAGWSTIGLKLSYLSYAKAPAVERSKTSQYDNIGLFSIDSTPGLWHAQIRQFKPYGGPSCPLADHAYPVIAFVCFAACLNLCVY